MTFQAGKSGNPNGRPKGSSQRHQMFNNLVAPHAEALVEKAIAIAKDNDTQMLKFFLERILPPKPKDEPIKFELPNSQLNNLTTIYSLSENIIKDMSKGEITPEEAHKIISMLREQIQSLGWLELKLRLDEIDKKIETSL